MGYFGFWSKADLAVQNMNANNDMSCYALTVLLKLLNLYLSDNYLHETLFR